MSMAALYDPAPRSGAKRILLIMLPGAKARPQDLLQHGFVRELRARNLPVDVVAVEAHLGHYLDRSLNGHLTNDIIAPARARNYRRIWLMGISLGGMGALIYAREHPAEIDGVVLLAPFLATRGVISGTHTRRRRGGLATRRTQSRRRRARTARMAQSVPARHGRLAPAASRLWHSGSLRRRERVARGAPAGRRRGRHRGRPRLDHLDKSVATLAGSGFVRRRRCGNAPHARSETDGHMMADQYSAAGVYARWRPAPLIRLSMWWHAAGAVALVAHPAGWPWVLVALAANHLVVSSAAFWPRGRWLGPNVTRLPAAAAARAEISLTFDDGPDPQVTPQVLDLLDRHAAKASFFCIGEKAAAFPDLVRTIVRRGHSVENHTYRHPLAFAFFGMAALRREIDAAQTVLARALPAAPRLFFRAPAGIPQPAARSRAGRVRHALRVVDAARL